MNGQRLRSNAPNGWFSNDHMRAGLEMALFDGLPGEIRQAVAQAPTPWQIGEVLESWNSARRRGMTAAEFAAQIPQN